MPSSTLPNDPPWSGRFWTTNDKNHLLALPPEVLLIIHAHVPGHVQEAFRQACAKPYHVFSFASFARTSTRLRLNLHHETGDRAEGLLAEQRLFKEALKRDLWYTGPVRNERRREAHMGRERCCSTCLQTHDRQFFTNAEMEKDPGERRCVGQQGDLVVVTGGDTTMMRIGGDDKPLTWAKMVKLDFQDPVDRVSSYRLFAWPPRSQSTYSREEAPEITYTRLDGYKLSFRRVLYVSITDGSTSYDQDVQWQHVQEPAPHYICPHVALTAESLTEGWPLLHSPFGRECAVRRCSTKWWLERLDVDGGSRKEIVLKVERGLGKGPTDPKWLAQLRSDQGDVQYRISQLIR
ncbi:hypothetical protein EJ05DRAFT_66335 [Pseudovirgaria hyperparasitica]|uniref:Uncharacterized protein n=1 Tax=Pseudovirgaria hyperparasitica TaxID=470096 RepID=A0A6A6W0S9_9PEZI|nr:uncharacterized protein EJ05DRAFT_66335 [Pseudovirgaria hyperparasitica]KAF2756502.1 hypothetical protein EJ05DRAFT_66335 [Pseudovirgaria hyperparasitica]